MVIFYALGQSGRQARYAVVYVKDQGAIVRKRGERILVEKGRERALCFGFVFTRGVTSFNPLGIEYRFCVIRIFIFETNISFLRHQDARQVNLNG